MNDRLGDGNSSVTHSAKKTVYERRKTETNTLESDSTKAKHYIKASQIKAFDESNIS